MGSLKMSCQPQWQFLTHGSKRRDQGEASVSGYLSLNEAFDMAMGNHRKISWTHVYKKEGKFIYHHWRTLFTDLPLTQYYKYRKRMNHLPYLCRNK